MRPAINVFNYMMRVIQMTGSSDSLSRSVPKLGRREAERGRWRLDVAARTARMRPMQPYLWQFLALTFAGWVNRSQQDAIEYLKERIEFSESSSALVACVSPMASVDVWQRKRRRCAGRT